MRHALTVLVRGTARNMQAKATGDSCSIRERKKEESADIPIESLEGRFNGRHEAVLAAVFNKGYLDG